MIDNTTGKEFTPRLSYYVGGLDIYDREHTLGPSLINSTYGISMTGCMFLKNTALTELAKPVTTRKNSYSGKSLGMHSASQATTFINTSNTTPMNSQRSLTRKMNSATQELFLNNYSR